MSKKGLNRFKVKKMFSSLLLSYGALLTVPLIIVLILTWFWDISTENYYKETVYNCLTEGRMAFEKRIELLHAGAFSLVYDSNLERISHFEGLNPGDSNVITLMQCQEKLNELYADSSKYCDYSVILRNGFVFRKKGMCIDSLFFYDNYRRYGEMTYAEWVEKSLQAESWQLYPLQQIEVDGVTEAAMTYSYPIRTGLKQKEAAKGAVQFLLPLADLQEMFILLEEMQGMVYIYDMNGMMLAEIGSSQPGGLEWDDLPESSGSVNMKRNGIENLVLRQDSKDGKLIFAAVLPLETALMNQKKIKLIAYIVLVLGVVFEMFLGIRFALRYSGPIRNIVENMQSMFFAEETVPLTDYEFLEKGVNDMQFILKEKTVKERMNFLTLLYGGNFHTEEEVLEEAKHVGIDLSAPGHYVMVLYAERRMEELLALLEEQSFSFVKACYMVNEQKAVLLIAASGQAEEDISEGTEWKWIIEELKEHNLQEVYIGIGRSYAAGNDLFFSFCQACYCADKARREERKTEGLEYSKVLIDLSLPWYPNETADKLFHSAKCGKPDAVRDIFDLLRTENIEKVHLSATIGNMLVSNIAMTLLLLLDSMAENENVPEIMERIEKEEDLEGAFALLEEQFLILSEKAGANRDKRMEEYYERLKAYMEEKYSDRQFCMSVAAEEFGLSESYFSAFFKETMGRSFSSYLENLRLGKARELISEGRYDLEEISSMVGYSSSATFRRAFKRAYGVAPSAWNKEA